MRLEKWVSPKKMIVLDIDETGGSLKLLDYRKNKTNTVQETTLARF